LSRSTHLIENAECPCLVYREVDHNLNLAPPTPT
jgi:hypothetical protein